MRVKGADPKDVVLALMKRSQCAVQVAAVLIDRYGVWGWGWNSAGGGFGEHAEQAVIRRVGGVSRDRLSTSTLLVAARRKRNGRCVTAKPCSVCQPFLAKVNRVLYRDSNGHWQVHK